MRAPSHRKTVAFPLKSLREICGVLSMSGPAAVTKVVQMKLEVNQICLPNHLIAFKNSTVEARKEKGDGKHSTRSSEKRVV